MSTLANRALPDSIAQAVFVSHTITVAHNHAHCMRILHPELSLYLTAFVMLDTSEHLEKIAQDALKDCFVQAKIKFKNVL